MSTRAQRQAELMSLYDTLPGGQTQKERSLYGFIPGEWLPNWVKQGYNQSIEGMARQVMNGESVFNVDEGYDPNMAEDVMATVMSFATPTDFATMVLGGGIGGAAVKGMAVKGLTKEFAKRAAVKSGMKKVTAVRLVNSASTKILNQARAKAVTGATGLGFYSGLQSALGQKVTRGDVDIVTTLKDTAKGATLGALTGGIGGKVQQATAARGLGKYQSLGAEKLVETGVFGTASPLLEGEAPSVDSYIHAAGVIGGLTLKKKLVSKTIDVPRKMINEAANQKRLRADAEIESEVRAKERRGSEEWSDGKKNVRIITDWTGKERNEQHLTVKDVKTNKTFNVPKKNFFNKYQRTKDNFGDNINTKITRRIFGLKNRLNFDDLDLKSIVDRVSGVETPSPPVRRKGKKGFSTNLGKLTQEQKYKVLMELETSRRTNEILEGYKKAGIDVKNVSGDSLLKKTMPPVIYDAFKGFTAKYVKPAVTQLTDPISQSAKLLIDTMNSKNSLIFSRIASKLNEATYIDKDGVSHKFENLSGFFKSKKKKKLREELANDMESSKPEDIARTKEIRRITQLVYRVGKRAGLDLAPFLDNYFPQVIKPEIIKILYKDIDRISDLDARTLSSDLTRKAGFEQNLESFLKSKDVSRETIDALRGIQLQMIENQRKGNKKINVSSAQAFEVLRDTVLSERVLLNKNLEKKRSDFKLPQEFYERDAGVVLTNYISQATKRIAYAQVVGKDGKGMFTKLQALRNKGLNSQVEILSRAFDTFTGLIETDPKLNYSFKVKSRLNDFVNFQVATKIGLGFATIPNITQTLISSALKLGYSPFFKGTFRALTDKKYRAEIRKNSGAGTLELHNIIVGFQSGQGTKLGKLADITTRAFGFQGINRVNKLISAYSAFEAAKGWQKIALSKPRTLRQAKKRDMAIRNLREMGVKDLSMKMTAKSMGRVMSDFAKNAQLQRDTFLEPAFASNPKMQPFLLFKRFGYRQAEMMSRWANQAMKDKDMAFFLRLGAAGAAGGIFVNWAKATLSNLLAGNVDIYNTDYKIDVDGKDYTMADFIQGLMAVGSFGIVTDIVASESKWRSIEFLAKPAVIQDAFKLYDALLRIGSDMMELGPNAVTARRAVKYIAPVFGTGPKRAARQLETPKQRADRRRTMLTSTKKQIFDYMLQGNDVMVKRLVREWNREFTERPLMMDDISPEEINKYLMRKYERLSKEMIDPATQPKEGFLLKYR